LYSWPAVVQLLEHGLHDALVALVRGGGPAVVAHVQLVPEGCEMLGDAVDKLLRAESGLVGAFLHLLAVLVDAGEEVHLTAVLALEAGHHVSENLLIGVADVRRRVRVVDGGGDVVGLHNRRPPGTDP